MKDILYPVLSMGALGLVLGALLAIASKIFAVQKDEKAQAISEVLPGANCGSCGFAGCSAYASAISKDGAKINACCPGGQSVADKIAEIMGVESAQVEEKVAVVRCSGTKDVAFDKFIYCGVSDCAFVTSLQGAGQKQCDYGCLGFGSCAKACSRGAISIVDGVAVIDAEKCGGCGECVAMCPKNLIELVPKATKYVVKCQSCDKGAQMKEKCTVGCIGCKICEKNCEAGAIKVENNHAVIDYSKCTSCGVCAEKCPKKIIIAVSKEERPIEEYSKEN